MFVLVDDGGSHLGEFDWRAEAARALEGLIAKDPPAALACGVIEIDGHGRHVGEPITARSPTPR